MVDSLYRPLFSLIHNIFWIWNLNLPCFSKKLDKKKLQAHKKLTALFKNTRPNSGVQKQRALKHRNTQNGSKSTDHKSLPIKDCFRRGSLHAPTFLKYILEDFFPLRSVHDASGLKNKLASKNASTRVHGSCASIIQFFRLPFRNCKSCVYNWDDLLPNKG